MKIKLKFPFTAPSGQHIEALDTRRLKVKDIKYISRQAGGDEAQMETLGVALMAAMIPEDLDEMDAADYQVLKGRFLEVLGIGAKSVGGSPNSGEVVPVSAE